MAHKLISFLGKGRKEGGGYRRTRYHFKNSNREYHTPFFGQALLAGQAHENPSQQVPWRGSHYRRHIETVFA